MEALKFPSGDTKASAEPSSSPPKLNKEDKLKWIRKVLSVAGHPKENLNETSTQLLKLLEL
jgi:hypothetical protein